MSNKPFEYEIKIPTENISGLLCAAPDNTYFDPYSCIFARKQYDKIYCFPPQINNYIMNYHTLCPSFPTTRGIEQSYTLLRQSEDYIWKKNYYSLIDKKYWRNQFFKVSTYNLNYISQNIGLSNIEFLQNEKYRGAIREDKLAGDFTEETDKHDIYLVTNNPGYKIDFSKVERII